ncbi:MAG TPA: winged helix DNA-binding domain-containing protein [Balneolaceae bacterium]
MKPTDVTKLRLFTQQIAGSEFKNPANLVHWMGAMQAQNYSMAKWAVGVRLPNSTDKIVEAAVDEGEIIRTHLLRPTWHLVAASDIHWMLELTAPRIKASMKSRHEQLGLTPSLISKSNKLLEEVLRGGNHLTRGELKAEFKKINIETDNNRISHLLLRAELDGVICSGRSKGNSQTYALLDERVPEKKSLSRNEALAELARRYFSSHGPATVNDFAWWSGLTLTDSRKALEMVKSDFITDTINSQTYWFSNSFFIPEPDEPSVHLLPAYDEFIISYTDRGATLSGEHNDKAISKNGMFWPVVIVNGQVAGLWKRTIKGNKVNLEVEPFQPFSKTVKDLIEKKATSFGDFLGKKAEEVTM